MKGAFGVEAIGLHTSEKMLAKQLGLTRGATPWVAQLVGLCDRYGYQRRFLRYKSDWAQANSTGSRGVWLWWTLEAGKMYETKYRTSWSLNSWQHRFLTVTCDGDVVDVTEAQLRAHLTPPVRQPQVVRRQATQRRVVRRVLR